jgi:hypothetical protein
LESSLMSLGALADCPVTGGTGVYKPISRAGFEIRSKNRLIAVQGFPALTFLGRYIVERLAAAIPVVQAILSWLISFSVSERNSPGGRSSLSGP